MFSHRMETEINEVSGTMACVPSCVRQARCDACTPIIADARDIVLYEPIQNDEPVPVVQFKAPIYYVEKDEGKIQLDITCVGDQDGVPTVKYRTVEGSAKEGRDFCATTGEVTLGHGQSGTKICIPIVRDESWAATLEFKVELFGPVNCELALYSKTARVILGFGLGLNLHL
eukprot:gnl/TRDRNA2_/TRDRNA2_144352_c2_seq1.p1 gnl/TRDRNA2_/TRDRNA2_144352_c2~~gnl/TRDRNA2_/TRDRNA2_144352_c2_seq1.p1  ORF type:complete len:172 (+),score=13.82 gnl/TRDRNA2_/TRDRNA2_144352_c2_seq1:70-585(+)